MTSPGGGVLPSICTPALAPGQAFLTWRTQAPRLLKKPSQAAADNMPRQDARPPTCRVFTKPLKVAVFYPAIIPQELSWASLRMKTCNEPSFAQEKAANRLCFEWGAGSRPWSFTPSKRPDAVAQSLSRGAGWGGGRVILPRDPRG